jgi:hypothetical protein
MEFTLFSYIFVLIATFIFFCLIYLILLKYISAVYDHHRAVYFDDFSTSFSNFLHEGHSRSNI